MKTKPHPDAKKAKLPREVHAIVSEASNDDWGLPRSGYLMPMEAGDKLVVIKCRTQAQARRLAKVANMGHQEAREMIANIIEPIIYEAFLKHPGSKEACEDREASKATADIVLAALGLSGGGKP